MGVVNVTPDSFSGDGLYKRWDLIVKRAEDLVESGADAVDVGGESTRPGCRPVPEDEELSRVVPAVRAIRGRVDVPISVDTSKVKVARAALDEGATIVNDVSGMRNEAMLEVVVEMEATLVLVHRGGGGAAGGLVRGVVRDLRRMIGLALEQGVPEAHIVVDPGLGMGKRWRENFEIMRGLPELRELKRPVLVGPSRKGMIDRVLGSSPGERLEGTAALTALCIAQEADVIRVHDVREMSRVARIMDAIVRVSSP